MDVKKYIFIFEEFDTMPGVGRRDAGGSGAEGGAAAGSGAATPGKTSGEAPDMAQMAMMLMAGQKKDGAGGEGFMDELREERKAAADKLDLGYLLRKLDGLESGEGRIIIATTNHPERIDPALLRPGRFGFQLHLTRCTGQMMVDMLRMIYQATEVSDERWKAALERLKGVPDLKWAPAEVLQLGVMLATPEEMVAHLLEKEPACFR
jgi:SpoVK/Ycf46/Vps4 family AAA+-type ATPase